MATVYHRYALEEIKHPDTGEILVKKGQKVLTSRIFDGQVRVLTKFWFTISADVFEGEEQFN